MSAIQQDVVAKLQEGTGTSLLATSEYQSWLHGETKTLLCVGGPGSGKTVLASQVIDILLRDGRAINYNPVLYFFVDMQRQQAEQQTAAYIVANLLKQLIHHNVHISNQTRRFFERHIKGGNHPTAEGLLACIEREAKDGRIFVVIDALDELAESCREELLGYMCQLQRECTMSLMTTSRPQVRTSQIFGEMFPGYRNLKIRQNQEDIEAYLVGQMHILPDVVMQDLDLQDYIKNRIMSLSNGVYVCNRRGRYNTDSLGQVSLC